MDSLHFLSLGSLFEVVLSWVLDLEHRQELEIFLGQAKQKKQNKLQS